MLSGSLTQPRLRGSSIYYALGLVAAYALGLTPVARLRLGLIKLAGASLLAGIDAELGIQVKL